MQVRLSKRSTFRGDLTVRPVLAGSAIEDGDHPWKVGESVGELTALRRDRQTRLYVSLGKKASSKLDTCRQVGGAIANWMRVREVAAAGVDAEPVRALFDVPGVIALAEGLMLGSFRFDEHKSERKKPVKRSVEILLDAPSAAASRALERAGVICAGTNLARRLAHQPPNVIDPAGLAAEARTVARGCGLRATILDEKQLARLKMGGILSAGRGSDSPPRIIILEHGLPSAKPPVVLVGKAVTFDTGGYTLKPKDGMLGMKYDKCGGTTVIGVMQAVAKLRLRVPVVGVIAAAENMISGAAYRPDDIIRTMSGKTVEIVSADAEGRMVLCDALTHVQRSYKPRCIIDLATLTGGVVVALGYLRGGLFCNNDSLRDALLRSADGTHERLWPLPMDDDYLDLLKGTDSDLKNSAGRDAHAIQGAVFLRQFVDAKVPWAHLDIAGTAHIDKDQAYCQRGATGFGVRLLIEYLSSLS